MGEFFKDEETKEEKKEEQPIADPQDLFAAYNVLKSKVEILTGEAYETIIPLRNTLLGMKTTSGDKGQIGQLRGMMNLSRLTRIPIGNLMWNTLERIEELDRWSERYNKYLEDFLDEYKRITTSSFIIISKMNKELIFRNREIEALRSRIITPVPPLQMPEKENRQMPKNMVGMNEEPEIPDIFDTLFDEKLDNYRRASKTGDEKLIAEARRQFFAICGKDKGKKSKVEEEIRRIEAMPFEERL